MEISTLKGKNQFFPNSIISSVKGGCRMFKGRNQDCFLSEASAVAVNDWIGKNPKHVVDYVKGLGFHVFSQDEYQKSVSEQFSAQYQELIEQKKSLEFEIKESKKTIETQAISLEKIKKKLSQKSEFLTAKEQELNSQIKDLSLSVDKEAEAKKVVNQKLTAQTNQVKTLEAKILGLNKEIEEYKTQIAALKDEKQKLINQHALLENQYNQLKVDYTQQQTRHQTAIETASSNITKQSKEIFALNAEKEELMKSSRNATAAFEEFEKPHAGCNVNDTKISFGSLHNDKKKSPKKSQEKTQKKSNGFEYSKDKAYRVLFGLAFCSMLGLPVYIYINSIKNGLFRLWELRHSIPSVSFKMPHIPFSNPFANFSIGDQIALKWALLRNYLHI